MLALADALRRRADGDAAPADHLPRHRPRHGDPAGPRPRLRAAADPAGAAAAQAHPRPAPRARPGVARGRRDARRCSTRCSADVVVGFGGYVALPAYLAARRARIPVVVHEQNALPGLANRIGAADRRPGGGDRSRHAAAPGRARRHAPADGDQLAGPGRAGGPRPGPSSGWTPTGRRCWSFGGSQGAASLNRAAVAAADALTAAGRAGAARPGPEEHRRRRSRRAPRGVRRTSSWTIWSAWTSPTPPPTSPCAGPAR